MKKIIFTLIVLSLSTVFASTPEKCFSGDFKACRDIMNNYGRQSDKAGAVEFFEKVCSSQSLLVSCRVVSATKSDSLQKGLEVANPNSGMFIISGRKIDKIYQVSEVK